MAKKMGAVTVLAPSDQMYSVFHHNIVAPVLDHKNSIKSKSVWFGVADDKLKAIIDRAHANIDDLEARSGLSKSQLALAYAFFHMRQHFFELRSLLGKRGMRRALETALLTDDKKWKELQVIDIGCGPGTGALAILDDRFIPYGNWSGFDQSKALLKLGQTMLNNAYKKPLIGKGKHRDWKFSYSTSLPSSVKAGLPALFVLSYCLACPTIPRDEILELVTRTVDAGEPVLVAYTNAVYPAAYSVLDEVVPEGAVTVLELKQRVARYRKKTAADEVEQVKFVGGVLGWNLDC